MCCSYSFLFFYQLQIAFGEEDITDVRERGAKGFAYRRLGTTYFKQGDFQKALEYYQLHFSIATDVGDKAEEEIGYSNLGNAFYSLGQFEKALKYHKLHLSNCKENENRAGLGNAYGNLGATCYSLGQFAEALEYLLSQLSIAREVGDRHGEGKACGNLGLVYNSLAQYEEALEYHKMCVSVSKQVGDRAGEGKACGSLGVAYYSIGDIKEAVKYHQLDLSIARELGDRVGEEKACSDLGIAYYSLGEFDKAMEYHKLHLSIAKEVGDKHGEGRACANIGLVYHSLGDFQKTLEYNKLHLTIAKDAGNKTEEGKAYANIGIAYACLGDFNNALECHQKHLNISRDVGDKAGEGAAYTNLGLVYQDLGNFQAAKDYHMRHLRITEETGDKDGEGKACANLGLAFVSLFDFEEASKYFKIHLDIAKEVGDIYGEGKAYGNLGLVYHSLGKFEIAKEHQQMCLDIARKVGNRDGEGDALGNLGLAYHSLGDFKQALDLHKLHLEITREVGNISGESLACNNLGLAYYSLGDLWKTEEFLEASVSLQDKIRDRLHRKDDWKISVRNYHDNIYTALWKVQLELDKTAEALFTAERGRGQALMDLMESQYGLQISQTESGKQMENIIDVLNHTSSQTVFVAVDSNAVNFWILNRGKQFNFVQKKFASDLKGLVEEAYQNIGVKKPVKCDDRSLDDSTEGRELGQRPEDDEGSSPQEGFHDALKVLYNVVIGPIADIIKDGQVTIVPDGPLYFVPFAALKDEDSRYLSETISVRLVPSLTSLKLMAECPEGYHCTTGALLVGDPWVESVRIRGERVKQLPSAKEEVEMIGTILKSEPLTGKEATKAEVLSRLNSVALVHIAAHGRAETGEIVLSPNPTSSRKPKEADFLLKMKDVLNAKLRAKLVVLSCCHSGRGDMKAEGVVGIARAFLGAGARSVLVSLWAIDDKATLEFMRHFYQHLVDGNCASKSVNQAMKCMRESEDFNKVSYWAPFVLIGDDVIMNFAETR